MNLPRHVHCSTLKRRRGVVLILVLGMLALLALIGVTFATFASQSKIGARNFAQTVNTPDAADVMDYALNQLINDTDNPLSAIRGHSLKRDMYGNDGSTNGILTSTPNGPLLVKSVDGLGNIVTNIPFVSGVDYTGWILKLAPTAYGFDSSGNPVVSKNPATPPAPAFVPTQTMQSFVVTNGSTSGTDSSGNTVYLLSISATDSITAVNDIVNNNGVSALIQPSSANNHQFILDGRYRFAFNGPGIKDAYASSTNLNPGQYGNYRVNTGFLAASADESKVTTLGHGSPGSVGMDEDYDACDLENWFLAIQSADGQVMVPSFHRPGILTSLDWLYTFGDLSTSNANAAAKAMAKILRPRSVDHGPNNPFGNGVESPTAGQPIGYDVDNDADGKTDSVWLDLGYPPRRNAQGKLYKPLFAFMVIGLNGRIPLNTAGNLAGRDPDGTPNSGQTTHLGNSVSEVDPTYALQNALANSVLTNPSKSNIPYGQFDDSGTDTNSDGIADSGADVRTTQLQNLLAGTRPIPPEILPTNPLAFTSTGVQVYPTTPSYPQGTAQFGDLNYAPIGTDAYGNILRYYMPNGVVDTSDVDNTNKPVLDPTSQYVARIASTPSPVGGRWGEASSISGLGTAGSPLLAKAYNNPARAGYSLGDRDVDDDNLNAFDPYRLVNDSTHFGEVGDSDLYDASCAPLLPVERIRRFVTPADIDGSGQVIQWPGSSSTTYGADAYGRVAFLSYFRPAGLPGVLGTGSNSTLSFATSATDMNGNQIPAVDTTNNPLHGYDFYRFPFLANATRSSQRVGGMPTNSPLDSSGNVTATTGTVIPTYDSSINGGLRTDGQNEADEMNLYVTSRNDQPYSMSDLEWLYRSQDVDGSSLSSRLSQLAPISLTNPVDGLRRRRLFSIDSWELTNYAWANDNPQNAFPNNSRFTTQTASTGFPVTADVVKNGYTSLLHRDKKINLNYPLPVSNDPNETVRQKWIQETYVTLKSILPPLAVDTAEELAQLSQYVVNIIDFRDPDCTMTRFVNTDISVTAATAGTPPVLVLTNPATVTNPYSTSHNTSTENYLVQFGMEYNPIAINEVLAYSFIYNNSSNKNDPTYARDNRFFIELVNTLTDAAVKGSSGFSPSKLNLGGFGYTNNDPYVNGSWDLVFTDDSPISRPDPFTGQLINANGNFYSLIPLNRDAFDSAEGGADLSLLPLPSTGDPRILGSMTPTNLPSNYFCVIGNPPAKAGMEAYEPSKTNPTPTITGGPTNQSPSLCRLLNTTFDPLAGATSPSTKLYIGVLPGVTSNTSGQTTTYQAPPNYKWKIPTNFPLLVNKKFSPSNSTPAYYWVCLRRPANPFAQVSVANPMVVVDAVRFPYIDATGTIDASPTPNNPPIYSADGYVAYSVKRWQPFRGGQAIPLAGATPTVTDWRYGYTEQMVPPGLPTTSSFRNQGYFDSSVMTPITRGIYHSLGLPGGSLSPTGSATEGWNYFPFNDRDFTSVAELLLVPGCSPGLFTKQFVEFAANSANSPLFSSVTPLNIPPSSTSPPTATTQASNTLGSVGSLVIPTASPYLLDKFFYSTANPSIPVTPTTTLVDDQTSAGWYKMFEFFEVPSQSMAAYGPVAQGANFDWFRQDVKPGLINLNLIIDEEVFLSVFGKQSSSYAQQLLNFTRLTTGLPGVVTSLDTSGNPQNVTISNVGYIDTGATDQFLKAAFVQFLKLRHGGSGNLFGFGSGAVGTATAAERPFRSLSYPDINQTIMRPASLPPSASSSPVSETTAASGYVGDPGLKNPFRYPGHAAATAPAANVLPPAIPARRLFQTPDNLATSNAGLTGDSYINTQTSDGSLAVGTTQPNLIAAAANLGSGTNDNSQQPYFRTEMLQKVMNLTTVRTHQYAVWITVGFFEVTRAGNPDLVDSSPALAYDQLGREVGLNGKIVRYRGFYVVDRTKATGFNPANPGDYHNCVVYGHVIQ